MLPYIDAPFAPLAKVTGASTDELKLLFSFLLSYPLAGLLKRLPDSSPTRKNLFIIGVSFFYLIGLFDLYDGIRTILYSATAVYLITSYVQGPLMPWLAFAFLMGHMAVNHLERQFANNPGLVDITGAQMVMVMKLSGFAWNVHDGRLKPETLTAGQKDRAITSIPPVLDYAGFVLFFPSLMAGPAFEYNDYRRWLETTLFDVPANTPAPETRKKRRIPRSGRPATFKAVAGMLWILAFIKFSTWYTVPFALSSSFTAYPFLRRVWYIYMLAFTARLKYYGVWSLTEGACILSGLGFNGIDPTSKRPRWDRLQNVNPWAMETAQNSRAYLDNWNQNTNVWLRQYIYLRVTPRGRKPGFRASLATFATSAFWHGFYPGYYLTFLLGAFIQTVAKNFRRHVRPFFLDPARPETDRDRPGRGKRAYDIFSWLVTQLAFSFTVTPFVVLRLGDSLEIWRRLWFYAVVGVALTIAVFSSPLKPALIHAIKNRETNAQARLEKTSGKAGSNDPTSPSASQGSHHQPSLGLPDDLERDVDEAVAEIRSEVEARRRRGSAVRMPTGAELRVVVEEKVRQKMKEMN